MSPLQSYAGDALNLDDGNGEVRQWSEFVGAAIAHAESHTVTVSAPDRSKCDHHL